MRAKFRVELCAIQFHGAPDTNSQDDWIQRKDYEGQSKYDLQEDYGDLLVVPNDLYKGLS